MAGVGVGVRVRVRVSGRVSVGVGVRECEPECEPGRVAWVKDSGSARWPHPRNPSPVASTGPVLRPCCRTQWLTNTRGTVSGRGSAGSESERRGASAIAPTLPALVPGLRQGSRQPRSAPHPQERRAINHETENPLKSGHDESGVALKRAVAALRTSRGLVMESQGPSANPRVEHAIGKWRGQFRKLKLRSEVHVGGRIERTHPMIPQMVRWASDAMLKFESRENGRTRYEELTECRACHAALAFGQSVQLMLSNHDSHRNKFDAGWQDARFLITRSSVYPGSRGRLHTIAPRRGVVRAQARSARRA